MARVVVTEHLTLDGVMQAPGRADEDDRGGFEHGGWGLPYGDQVMGEVLGAGMARDGAILLGRRTYEDFAGFWPRQKDNPFTPLLNRRRKYVASTTLTEPLPWSNSTLLDGDLSVLGSGELVQSLMRRDLIDEYLLMIHPLVLGSGRRLFTDSGAFAALRLVDSRTTTTGVVIATYQPAERSAGQAGSTGSQ